MKKLTWIWIPLSLALFFSVCARAEKAETPAPAGDMGPAPAFTLTDLNGNEITLSGLNDKVIFLNFWATWCPPCREEIPGFIEVFSKYKDKGMEIIGVSVDRNGVDKVRSFVQDLGINYPVAMETSQITNDYKPGRYIPTTIVIDKKGKIRHKHVGYMDKTALENLFLEISQ